jgi:hypothetical protein
MRLVGWLKAVLSVVLGLAVGLVVTGLVNLLHPVDRIGWTLAAVLLASALSALIAFFVTNLGRKPPAPAARTEAASAQHAGAGTKKESSRPT